MGAWSLEAGDSLKLLGLGEELAGRQQAFVDWRKLEAGVRSDPRAQDA